MAAYLVATVHITDPATFALYGKAVAGLAEQFGGVPVVKGTVQAFLEGQGPADERVVVTRFPDAAAARAYLSSPQYVVASAHRTRSSSCTMRLLAD